MQIKPNDFYDLMTNTFTLGKPKAITEIKTPFHTSPINTSHENNLATLVDNLLVERNVVVITRVHTRCCCNDSLVQVGQWLYLITSSLYRKPNENKTQELYKKPTSSKRSHDVHIRINLQTLGGGNV